MMCSKYGDNHIRDNLTKRSFPQLEFDVTERDEGHDKTHTTYLELLNQAQEHLLFRKLFEEDLKSPNQHHLSLKFLSEMDRLKL